MKSFTRFLLYLFLVLVVLSGTVFTLKNLTPVSVWLIHDLRPLPLAVWLIGAFICGGLLGLLLGFGLWHRFRTSMHIRQLETRLHNREREIRNLNKRLESESSANDAKPAMPVNSGE